MRQVLPSPAIEPATFVDWRRDLADVRAGTPDGLFCIDVEMDITGSSFRDPAGHVFVRDGRLLRQVNHEYAADYDQLMASGLYESLAARQLLVPHDEVEERPHGADAYRVLQPERIPFISYPFEWTFSQLKSAALTTLAAQRLAVEQGMGLKDASAYNVQFIGSAPVLIDTLSFERWTEGTPWVAYRQFCQHFLGPLALMSATDVRLSSLSRVFIDGPPLDLVSALLPVTSRFHPSLLTHVHLHAAAQARHGGAVATARVTSASHETTAAAGASGSIAVSGRTATRHRKTFSKRAMLGLIDHLESAVNRLTYRPEGTTWADYYANTNYSESAMSEKQRLVAQLLAAGHETPHVVWDLGANTGAFSRIAADAGAYVVAIDADPAAAERHVLDGRTRDERRILPLVMDLSNPSSAMGWAHRERASLEERGPADVALALGLLHHVTIANHVPFEMSADFFARLGRTLIIEFVPRGDSQVDAMLARMPKAADGFTREAFENAYAERFEIQDVEAIAGSSRVLYRMTKKEGGWGR